MKQELALFTDIYNPMVAYLVEYSFQIVNALSVLLIGIQITPFIAAIGAACLGGWAFSLGASVKLQRRSEHHHYASLCRRRRDKRERRMEHCRRGPPSHTVLINEDSEIITIPNKPIVG